MMSQVKKARFFVRFGVSSVSKGKITYFFGIVKDSELKNV